VDYNPDVEGTYLDLAMRSIQTALYMASPILAVTLAVGFLISIFQAVTSIQEQTLTFVPKIFVAGVGLIVFGPWMLAMMNSLAAEIFGNLPSYIR
jgi:flagellar biosynthetic protein FliQ